MNQPIDHRAEPAPAFESQASLPQLIKQLADQTAHLLTTEVNLAKAELKESTAKAKAGAMSLGAGAIVLLVGLIGLMASAILGLSQFMEPWQAALAVGAVISVIGLIMVFAGKKELDPAAFKPERTGDQLREDGRLAKRAIK